MINSFMMIEGFMDGLAKIERKQIYLVCNFFTESAHVDFPADVLVTVDVLFSFFLWKQHKSRVMEAIYICRQRKAAAVLAVQLKEHWTAFCVSDVKKRWTETWRTFFFVAALKKKAIAGDFVKMIDYAVYRFRTIFSLTTLTSPAVWCIKLAREKNIV